VGASSNGSRWKWTYFQKEPKIGLCWGWFSYGIRLL